MIEKWKDSLKKRRLVEKPPEGAHEEYKARKIAEDAKLRRKFPGVFDPDARPQTEWMSPLA